MDNNKSSISKGDESLQPLHEDIKSILKSINEIKDQQETMKLSVVQSNESNSKESKEIKSLRAQLRGMEILMQQNCALEKEVENLCKELDEVTLGVQKKGYLNKWRDREISFASKWSLRYFVLQGNKLSYYLDDKELRPRKTFDLSKCFVREDGVRKGGLYHVFSIYLSSSDNTDLDGSLLLRLSTDNIAESAMWIDMLEQACVINDMDSSTVHSPLPNSIEVRALSTTANSRFFHNDNNEEVELSKKIPLNIENNNDEDWSNVPIDPIDIDSQLVSDDGADLLNPIMLKRVRSSSIILRKSMSRQTMARRILSGRAPNDFTESGHRISQFLDDKKWKKQPINNNNIAMQKRKQTEVSPKERDGTTVLKSFPAYKPMHVESVASPLSSDTRPGQHNFRGFFNLGVIILILSHFDLIVNNMAKYGLKITIPFFHTLTSNEIEITEVVSFYRYQTAIISIISWSISVLLNFTVEVIAKTRHIPERYLLIANIILGTINIVGPTIWVWYSKSDPLTNMVYLFQSVIVWMKLISYSHANKDLRVVYKRSKKFDLSSNIQKSVDDMRMLDQNSKSVNVNENLHGVFSEVKDLEPPFILYPQNITLLNIGFFMIAPTLCYQLNYPRTARIRWKHVFSIVARLFFVGFLIVFSVEQYIKPTLETSVVPMQHMDVLSIVERLLKLSIPNTYVWLWSFYWFFHLWMNLLAELTRFGDREFYKDWWNARYWRTWNMPVHNWITRHLYHPLLRAKTPKLVALLSAFAFSAVFHELIISIPFKRVSLHAFFGMLAQAPLIFVTRTIDRRFDNAFIGNAIFWCIFCVVGQPMGIIMYYYDIWKDSVAMNRQ